MALIKTKWIGWLRFDGRHFQIISQVTFLCYGIIMLGWDADWKKYLAAFSGSILAQALAIRFGGAPGHSMKSAIITSLGISLLFKANSPWLFLFAALFAIGQKFLVRINGKHIWNPANFGIVVMILLSGEAWISPGQWGSSAVLVFIIGTGGLAVLSHVKRLETGFAFMLTIAVLEYFRTIVFLGWEWDVLLLKLSSGSLWLFALFMITDPMTIPNGRITRIIWSVIVASVSFYLTNFKFINAAPFWVLFFATPFTPVFDLIQRQPVFQWISKKQSPQTIQTPVIP
ncbi:MAG: RnfABCDGE type electron transport complex subunit D [Flavobacteriales bacterium]|nr:RnfABCDGE type electron transport complex subunit D [Flavobacteriales bacterium]